MKPRKLGGNNSNDMIQVALNGARSKSDNPYVPTHSLEILGEAIKSINAGANEIHFHVRDQIGLETLDPNCVAEQIVNLKKSLPGIRVGISTGEWIEPNIYKRKSNIARWKIYPDFVSLNISENKFEEVAHLLIEKDIPIEAGLSNSNDAAMLINTGLFKYCFRFLIEPQETNLKDALTNIEAIEKLIQPIVSKQDILLHGYDNTVWNIISVAFHKNYNTRIGFEDTIFIEPNIQARSNAELIEKAIRIRSTN